MPTFRTVTGPSGPKPDQIAPETPAQRESSPEPETASAPEWFVLLANAGFDTAEKIRQADDAELLAIEGIGPRRLQQIREATS